MDEMKIKLSTSFMKGIIAKIIKSAISKKLGFEIELEINEIDVKFDGGKVRLHADIDGEINKDEFVKIINPLV